MLFKQLLQLQKKKASVLSTSKLFQLSKWLKVVTIFGSHPTFPTCIFRGIIPTMLRQGCNQAVNFTTYNIFKRKVLDYQNKKELDHWQSLVLGGVSGGFGPLANNPLDVCKTRLQKQVIKPGVEPKYTGVVQTITLIYKEEGFFALWKGITPRLLRIVPGQAITFMTYEAVSSALTKSGYFA